MATDSHDKQQTSRGLAKEYLSFLSHQEAVIERVFDRKQKGLETKLEANLETKLEAMTDKKIEEKIGTKLEAMIEEKIEMKVEEKIKEIMKAKGASDDTAAK